VDFLSVYMVFMITSFVKTAHSFWPVNRDQKDRLTAAAYAAVKVGYMTL